MGKWSWIVLGVSFGCGAADEVRVSAAEAPGVVAFRNVNVIPLDEGPDILRGQSVVLEGGRITAVGPSGDVDIPEQATVVDGQGRYLMPGLSDMHAHVFGHRYGPPMLMLYIGNGITTIRNLSGDSASLRLRDAVAAGEIPGPRFFTAGWYVNEPRVHSPDDAEAAVEEHVAAGYDYLKMHGSLPEPALRRLADRAHAAGLRFGGHLPRNLPAETSLAVGITSVDHLEEFLYTYAPISDRVEAWLAAEDHGPQSVAGLIGSLGPAIDSLASLVAASGARVVPTLGAYEMIGRQLGAGFDSLEARPELRYVGPVTRWDWGPEDNDYRGAAGADTTFGTRIRVSLQVQLLMLRALYAAGVPLLTGSDAMNPASIPGFSLARELELMVAAGLPPAAVLRASARGWSEMYGMPGTRLAAGAAGSADLVLLAADPLADISNVRRVEGVVVAGRWWSRADLDAGLERLARGFDTEAERFASVRRTAAAGDTAAALELLERLDTTDPAVERYRGMLSPE